MIIFYDGVDWKFLNNFVVRFFEWGLKLSLIFQSISQSM
jgi:hypothetical protein